MIRAKSLERNFREKLQRILRYYKFRSKMKNKRFRSIQEVQKQQMRRIKTSKKKCVQLRFRFVCVSSSPLIAPLFSESSQIE